MVVGVADAVPEPADRRRRARAGLHGPRGRARRSQEIRARPRLHRLVHELAHRRPARRRARSSRAARSPRDVYAMVVPGSVQVKRAGRGRGPRRGLPRRRLRLARRGLLDVPGHEPRHPRARRALRLDLEPQLRGPPGPRRAHAPRLARRWPPRPPSRATSSTSASGADRWRPIETITGPVVGARPRRRRHRPDHPQAVPQARRAHRLRRVPLLRLGQGARLGPAAQPDPRHRAQLRLRLEPRARAVGAGGLRLPGDHRAELRRHLPLQLHEDRPAAGRAAADDVARDRRGRRGAGRPRGAGGPLAGGQRAASRSTPRSSTACSTASTTSR